MSRLSHAQPRHIVAGSHSVCRLLLQLTVPEPEARAPEADAPEAETPDDARAEFEAEGLADEPDETAADDEATALPCSTSK